MSFAKHLPLSHVVVDLDITSKKRLFEQIGLICENEDRLARAAVFDALMARERLGTTGLGCGVAIPHGRIKGLRDTIAIFIRTKEGVPFDAPDGAAVRLVMAMLVPEHASEKHLQLLSELAALFSDADTRAALLHEPDAARIHQRLINESSDGTSADGIVTHAPAQRTAAL